MKENTLTILNSVITEIDFERRVKRRKLYRERSVSPVCMEEEGSRPASPLPSIPRVHPDTLNREKNYEYKKGFLRGLNLEAVLPERRRGELFRWQIFANVLRIISQVVCNSGMFEI